MNKKTQVIVSRLVVSVKGRIDPETSIIVFAKMDRHNVLVKNNLYISCGNKVQVSDNKKYLVEFIDTNYLDERPINTSYPMTMLDFICLNTIDNNMIKQPYKYLKLEKGFNYWLCVIIDLQTKPDKLEYDNIEEVFNENSLNLCRLSILKLNNNLELKKLMKPEYSKIRTFNMNFIESNLIKFDYTDMIEYE